MPVAVAGAVDVGALALILALLLVAYLLFLIARNSPTFWPIGNSIKNLFNGAGNSVADLAGDITDIVVSGTGYAVAQTIKYVATGEYSIKDAVSYVAEQFWAGASGAIQHAEQTVVLGVMYPTVLTLQNEITALQNAVRSLGGTVITVVPPSTFDPSDVLRRLGALETTLTHDIWPRLDRIENTIGGMATHIDNILRDVASQRSIVDTITGHVIPDIIRFESGVVTNEQTFIGEIGQLRKDLTGVTGLVGTLSGDIASEQQIISHLTAALAKLAPLAALAGLSVAEIATLEALAANPCLCLSPTGSFSWLTPVVIANSLDFP